MSLKTIKAAVGEQCLNIPADVATVQYLLNCVPVSHGGPTRELVIDGFAGVLTHEAVRQFQKVHFGVSDSRIESDGNTFSELKKYDPLPFSAPVITPNFKKNEIAHEGIKRTVAHIKRTMAHEGIKRTMDGVKGRS